MTDNAVNKGASITITTSVATTLANGNYVFQVSGLDKRTASPEPYFYTGAFTVVGGVITTGEQDYIDLGYDIESGPLSHTPEPITGGTITASPDGNLLITLTFVDATIANGAGTVTLNASLVSASKALLTEYDTWASGSGELDLQSSTLATPTGAYAFFSSGVGSTAAPLSVGGVMNVDGAGTISGTGSILDINDQGNLFPAQVVTASTVTGPDGLGKVTWLLNTSCTCITGSFSASMRLDGYMVDANHIRVIENWYNDDLTAVTGGTMLLQTVAQPFTSVTGSYVVGTKGGDTSTLGILQFAGILTFNSGGTLSGNLSFNDGTNVAPQGGITLSSGTYTLDPGGTGDVTVSATGPFNGANVTFNLQLYLTGDGHALVISMDTTDVLGGFGWQQTASLSPASLSGSYALGLTQVSTSGTADAVGAFVADGSANLSGYLDVNGLFTGGGVVADNPISASYAVTPTNGDFTVTNSGATFNATAYLVDNTKGVLIENDSTQLSLGYFELQ